MKNKKLVDYIVLGLLTLFVCLAALTTIRHINKSAASPLDGMMRRVDSLKRDSAGRKTYDSFMRVHPGILDSIITAQKYYEEK